MADARQAQNPEGAFYYLQGMLLVRFCFFRRLCGQVSCLWQHVGRASSDFF
jgi:hypothetical protein